MQQYTFLNMQIKLVIKVVCKLKMKSKLINDVASDYIYNVICKTDIGRQMARDMLFLNNPITMTTRKLDNVFIA